MVAADAICVVAFCKESTSQESTMSIIVDISVKSSHLAFVATFWSTGARFRIFGISVTLISIVRFFTYRTIWGIGAKVSVFVTLLSLQSKL